MDDKPKKKDSRMPGLMTGPDEGQRRSWIANAAALKMMRNAKRRDREEPSRTRRWVSWCVSSDYAFSS